MSDLISRQAAIDAIHCDITVTGRQNAELVATTIGAFADRIKALPSAQPEIIRCKDCRYYNSEEKECLDLLGHGRRWEEDDFCSYGERNEVTE